MSGKPLPPRDPVREAIDDIRSPAMIRERCEHVLAAGLAGSLAHFAVELGRIEATADRVIAVTRAAYPDLRIPYHSRWNHFRAGGVDRVAELRRRLSGISDGERAQTEVDLVVTSVLLDAGAGDRWRYVEPGTGLVFSRSEGLAVASYHMFVAGLFSSDPAQPLRADVDGLAAVDEARIAAGFQVGPDNPMAGLAGRASLIRSLGAAVRGRPLAFGEAASRPGGLYPHLCRLARGGLPARWILGNVLEGLSPIWPGRVSLGGENLGDVWPHPAAGGSGPTAGLVPFHKLSQWLSYSLIEVFEASGVPVTEVDELTGLPEYRNGGLLVDMGVLVQRHGDVVGSAHLPGSEVIVEWRALTVALLDRVADAVRGRLGLDAAALPLAKILEGGTWAAGRQLAAERRGGAPPIRIESDGTVF